MLFSSLLLSVRSIFCSEGIVMLFSSTHHLVCQDLVQFLPFTVEVLSKLYQSYSFSIFFNQSVAVFDLYHSLYISCQPRCLHVFLVHCNPFLMSSNLQGSHDVPCSSFLSECFQLHSSPLLSFFQFV